MQYFRVYLGPEHERQPSNVEPHHQSHDRAERAKSVVVVGYMPYIPTETPGRSDPAENGDDGSRKLVFEALLRVGSQEIDRLHRQDCESSDQQPSNVRPPSRE